MAVAIGQGINDQYRRPRWVEHADKHVGARIRERRIMLGLSLVALARRIGVTYQQANKYERGINRVSSGHLYQIAQTLGVGVDYLFEDLAKGSEFSPSPQQRLMLELTRSFAGISNPGHRAALCELARALSAEPANEDDELAAE